MVPDGERKVELTNLATARFRKLLRTRIYQLQLHMVPNRSGDHEAFLANGQMFVESSSNQVRKVSDTHEGTARAKSIVKFSVSDLPTEAAITKYASTSHTWTLGWSTIAPPANLIDGHTPERESIRMTTCELYAAIPCRQKCSPYRARTTGHPQKKRSSI